MRNDAAGASYVMVGAQASEITSADKLVAAGAGPRCATAGSAIVSTQAHVPRNTLIPGAVSTPINLVITSPDNYLAFSSFRRSWAFSRYSLFENSSRTFWYQGSACALLSVLK